MFGDHRKRGQQRERLERRYRVTALQRLDRHVEHGQVVSHEERVEPAALERLRKALDMREVEVRVRIGAGIAPGGGVDGRRAHERTETELPLAGHVALGTLPA
jgi:hypothetical protein